MTELLVIDDEDSILHAFRRAFREPEFRLRSASTIAEGLQSLRNSPADVAIVDVHLPDGSGLDAFEQIHLLDERLPVIFITGHGTTDLAIEAIKRGAYDYLLKPLELKQLRELIDRAAATRRVMVSATMTAPRVGAEAKPSGEAMVGRCPAMQEVYKAIGRVARQDVTVLILGESGTGKELVARAIHQHSRRADKPFLAINCAAIPEPLLESELFGHEKGAFTGADRQRVGKFEQCDRGTPFLDEVGDMTPLTQVKLLRLLQEQTFERVGGNQTLRADVRLIAATHAELSEMVRKGTFRQDLYFRLNVFPILLPPLRERGEDLPLLIDHFVRRFSVELDRPVQSIPDETLDILRRYPWPGNIRELQSVLKQTLLQMKGSVLSPEALPGSVLSPHLSGTQPTVSSGFDWESFVRERIAAGSEHLYAEALHLMEREVLVRVLQHTRGNQVQTARILGITRGSLRHKIRLLNISIEQSVWSEDNQAG